MSRVDWRDHIVIDPGLHHGDPCIRGTRIPVTTIVGSLADGMTADEVLAAYPQLKMVEVQAALAFTSAGVDQA